MKKIVGIGIFGIIIFILLSISLYSYLSDGNMSDLTLQSFLDILADAPSVDVSWSMVDLSITADWGTFNFLKEFFNLFISIIEFVLFIIGALWKGLNYILYIINSLFGFSVSFSPGAGTGGGGGGIW